MGREEKELQELEETLPELSAAGKEYIAILKTDKLQLWRENKKLKAALRKAAEQVVSICLGLSCPTEDCSAGNKSCVECRIRDWMELGDVATENIERSGG